MFTVVADQYLISRTIRRIHDRRAMDPLVRVVALERLSQLCLGELSHRSSSVVVRAGVDACRLDASGSACLTSGLASAWRPEVIVDGLVAPPSRSRIDRAGEAVRAHQGGRSDWVLTNQ